MILAPFALQAAEPAWECRMGADGVSWECFKGGLPVAPEPLPAGPETAPAAAAREEPPATTGPAPAAVEAAPVITPAEKPASIAAPGPAEAPAVAEEPETRPEAAPAVAAVPAGPQAGPLLDRGLNWDRCGPLRPARPRPAAGATAAALDETTHINADAAEFLRKEEVGIFSGNVEVTRGDKLVIADEIRYNNIDDTLNARGNVFYQEPDLRIAGSAAQFNLGANQGHMDEVEYRLPERMARGNAGRAEIEDKDRSHFQDISYTTCRPGNDSWLLRAETMDIDQAEGRGEARHVRLAVKGVPVFYMPYVSFPIDDRRKSGLLVPAVGQSDETGMDVAMPYYLNLAPNYDATITPRIMSKRGLMLGGEFRYLTKNHNGIIKGEILPDDNDRPRGKSSTRGAFSIREKGRLTPRMTLDMNVNHVSDTEYLNDLGGSLSVSAARQLERRADVQYHGDSWSLLARVQHFQSTDKFLPGASRAYNRLPQLKLSLERPNQLFGLTYHLNTEYVRFDRSAGVTGHRFDLHPGLSLPMRRSWGFLTPKVTARYTGYWLEDEAAGNPDDPDRFLPTLSLDSGLYFERTASWFGNAAVQTLEPRAYYLYIPYEEQDDQPVFDSSALDLNFANLFRENRFNGVDRVGDTNHLTLALTSRTMQAASGREFLRASIGSIFYFRDRNVQLPGVQDQDEDSSAIVGEIASRLTESWSARANMQWNPHTSKHTEKSALQLHYLDGRRRIFNLAYRFTRDIAEQTDISARWPVSSHIHLVGRWNYSLLHNRTMEGFGGFEYDGCCYVVRAVVRQYVNSANEDANTAFFIQLEFKGLTSVGSDIVSLLDRGIFGYALNN